MTRRVRAQDWMFHSAEAGIVRKDLLFLLWVFLTLLFIGLAVVTPRSNDEDQYVAAAFLAQHYDMYADFLYLQTPLQPYLFRHLVGVLDGYAFVGLRLASAVCALVTLGYVFAAQRRLGVPPRLATVAMIGLAGCVAFQFCAGTARNDALPAALIAVALWVTAGTGARKYNVLPWFAAGALLGLAACAKITFALPGGVLGVWLVARALFGRAPWHPAFALATGMAAGLLPLGHATLLAPHAVLYGIWESAARDTFAWYRLNGRDDLLHGMRKFYMAPYYLAQGPALLALGLVVGRLRVLPDTAQPALMLLVGGLLGALVPTPIWRQYLIVALPPLFFLFGVALAGLSARIRRPVTATTLGLAALATFANIGEGLQDWRRSGLPSAWRTTVEARWIGTQLRAEGWHGGTLATLSPSLALDSGFELDRRFSTGSNVFHIADRHSPARLERLNAIGPHVIDTLLDRNMPVGVITGYEGRRGNNVAMVPDAALENWATTRGYRRVASVVGDAVLWIRPRAQAR